MASHLRILCTFMAIFLATMNVSVEAARQFKVGDGSGWQEPPPNNTAFYTQWAAMNRFQVGDSLVFEYQNDSVFTVDKWDYYHCDSSDPITAYNNGKSIINLDQPGSFYFISGIRDHCRNGQRLMVEVISPRSPLSVAAPSPSHSSGVSVLSVVLSTCFSFMLIAFGVCFV